MDDPSKKIIDRFLCSILHSFLFSNTKVSRILEARNFCSIEFHSSLLSSILSGYFHVARIWRVPFFRGSTCSRFSLGENECEICSANNVTFFSFYPYVSEINQRPSNSLSSPASQEEFLRLTASMKEEKLLFTLLLLLLLLDIGCYRSSTNRLPFFQMPAGGWSTWRCCCCWR